MTDGPFEVTWSANHASQKRGKSFVVSIMSLLPLLRDEAHLVATVKHVIDKTREIVASLSLLLTNQYMQKPSRSSGTGLKSMVRISLS